MINLVLEYYGAENVPDSGGWKKIRCPWHSDRNPSASVNPDEDLFKCFACDIKGDSLAIIKQVEVGLSGSGAESKYKEITGGSHEKVRRRALESQGRHRSGVSDGPRAYERGSGFFKGGRRRRSGGSA